MSRTVTALFDTRTDAEAGRQRLLEAAIAADNIHIHDRASAGLGEAGYSTHEDRGLWDSIKHAFLPDEDRHTYEEGVRRGGYLLTADVEDGEVDRAVAALEQANGVDIEQRAADWRGEGWDYPAAGGTAGTLAGAETALDRDRPGERRQSEEVIPVIEEKLVVGKREVDRGGVRVRSYVTETPVREQIRLREERVQVERRSVDQPLSAATGDAFRERTIEMTETAEEAVVGKTARVTEEVVVSKTGGERTEEINETVRRTDVDVEQLGGDRRVEDVTGASTTGVPRSGI